MIQAILAILFSIQAHAEIQETPNLESCLKTAHSASVTLNPQEVVYVFDIDNTLLSLNQNLGSVQWFRWQQKLITENVEENRVAGTINELLTRQGQIYNLSKTHTPELTTANQVLNLQQSGHPVLYHTSRNTDVRDITERDLKSQNLLPLIYTIGPDKGYAGQITYPSEPSTQRAVSFQHGLYMTAGQDKGIWLKQLLRKTSTRLKHLVFVDDELKNLQNVERVFAASGTPMTLCRYAHEDQVVQEFNLSDKSKEIELWREFNAFSMKFQ